MPGRWRAAGGTCDIMEKLCLELDVVIDFLRGEKATVEKIKYYMNKEEICITPNTLTYLLIGLHKSEALKPFINSITVLEFDRDAATRAARIIEDNYARGKAMDTDEVMTAAACLTHGAFLFTKNRKKFEHLKDLKLV